jgi:DNA-binding transcriptional ArsR family regulator
VTKTAAIQAKYRIHAKIIKALAHPTRLFILEQLAEGERSVLELTEMVGVEMPTISRHLAVLKNAGILERDKRGPRVFHTLRARCVLEVFNCVREVQASGKPK